MAQFYFLNTLSVQHVQIRFYFSIIINYNNNYYPEITSSNATLINPRRMREGYGIFVLNCFVVH